MASKVARLRIPVGQLPPPLLEAALVSTEKYVYVLSGRTAFYVPFVTHIWRFHRLWHTWKRIPVTGHVPQFVASSSAVVLGNDWVFFFEYKEPNDESNTSRSLMLYSCNLSSVNKYEVVIWNCAETTGDPPLVSCGTSTVVHKQFAYVVNSFTPDRQPKTLQVYRCNLVTRVWERLFPTEDLSSYNIEDCHGFQIAILNDEIFALMGRNSRVTVCYLYLVPVFNMIDLKWIEKPTTPDPDYGFPAERKWHSITHSPDVNYVLYSGGCSYELLNEEFYCCVWKLDLATLQWTLLRTSLPEPFYLHSSTLTPHNRLFVFGGCDSTGVLKNKIFAMDIGVPMLKSLSLEAVVDYAPWLFCEDKGDLSERGIPGSVASLLLE